MFINNFCLVFIVLKMKKSLIFAICFFLVLFSSATFVSSEVSLGSSVNSVYNFGDIIKLPITLSFEEDFSDVFVLSLVCGEGSAEFYKEYIYLSSGDSASKTIYVPLIKDLVGGLGGECSIIYSLGSDKGVLVDNFRISDKINLNIEKEESNLLPGDGFNIRGTAIKENGKFFSGDLRVFIEGGNSEDIEFTKKVDSDSFSFEVIIPEDFEYGQHLVSVEATEFGPSGEKINYGKTEFFISIAQVPNNLELIFEEDSVNPGADFMFSAVLHDQTGQKMDSSVYFALRNSNFEIVRKLEGKTGEIMEYRVNDTQLPGTWSVSAYSNELTQRKDFRIREKESIKVDLVNETLIITNNGNIPYNDTVKIEIGDDILGIDVFLDYGSFAKYKLSAPKGVYEVSVEGVTEKVSLTGRAVDAKKVSSSSGSGMGNIFLWIFVIIILGFVLLLIVKRGYKKAFFGKLKNFPLPVHRKKRGEYKEVSVGSSGKSSLRKSRLPSEISLSIKGSKQNAGIVCLNIKNYSDVSEGQGNTGETLSKIISLVESSKGFVFSNKGSLFFIFAPSKTKTFRNEMTLIHIADEAKEILKEHNKKFKIKFDYGISLNYGTIVTKEEEGKMKFMTMGTLLSDSRRLANLSRGESLISEKVKERLSSEVKTDTKTFGSTKAYVIREILDRGKHDTFIKGFLARQQRDRMKEGK
jgi:hypothetical protein